MNNKSEHSAHDTPVVSHPRGFGVGYEIDRVYIRGIVTFLVFLSIMTIVSFLMMWGMFRVLNRYEQSKEAEVGHSPMAMTSKERLPPEPRLQAARGFGEGLETEIGVKPSGEPSESGIPKGPLWEINELREHWDVVLKDGVKDQSGRVSITPIEDAKKELLKQGLPVAADAKSDTAIEMPTAASSGRTTEKRKQ